MEDNLQNDLFYFMENVFLVEEHDQDNVVISFELKELLKKSNSLKIQLKIENKVVKEIEFGRLKWKMKEN